MAFHLLSPIQEKETQNAFTSWLDSQLLSDDADVRTELEELSNENDAFDSVIRKASKLVKAHSDDFKLPITEEESSEDQVYHLLLSQWNAFQNSGNGMSKAVFIEQGKSQVALPIDGKHSKTSGTNNEHSLSSSINVRQIESVNIKLRN